MTSKSQLKRIGTQKGSEILGLWTVYDHPTDMPDVFVARRWVVDKNGERPTHEIRTSFLLEELRRGFIADGLTCLPRSPEDDSKIVETWL